jgi:phage terminase large subunit GpA-like protein
VAVLTAGVDVQVDRFALQVIGWGPGLERWVVDWRAIPGDPKRPETQAALLEAIRTPYRHASGRPMRILGTCFDSGYETDMVYAFCAAHWSADRVWPTKGSAGHAGKPVVYKRGDRKPGRLLAPFLVNVDDAKASILAGLTATEPGPGFMHLSETVCDESYLSELTAEHREVQQNKSGVAVRQVWVQDRANEALDTAVLCLAALHVLGGTNPAAYVRRQADAVAAALSSSAAAPEPTVRTERRVARSKYLG